MANIRIISSLLAGATTGGLLVAGYYLLVQFVNFDVSHVLKYRLITSIWVFVMAFCFWLAGLVVVGLPFWFWMHKTRKTLWTHAVLLGFGLTFVVSFSFNTAFFQLLVQTGSRFSASNSGGPTWIDNRLTLHGWISAAQGALIVALAATLVASTIWWVAYKSRR